MNNWGRMVEPRCPPYGLRTHKKQSTSLRKQNMTRLNPNNGNELQRVKSVPKLKKKSHGVGFKSIWVRSLNLRPCVALPTNPRDDLGTSGGVNLAI